jgi:hypothetical protein
MSLWLIGGGGAVEMVLLVKWTKLTGTNQVKGVLEVYTLNPALEETLMQTEVAINLSKITLKHIKLITNKK